MTVPANKVSNQELFVSIVFKFLPAVVFVVFSFRFLRDFAIENNIEVPSFIYNFALVGSMLLVLRLTVWKMLQRLAAEGKKDDKTH